MKWRKSKSWFLLLILFLTGCQMHLEKPEVSEQEKTAMKSVEEKTISAEEEKGKPADERISALAQAWEDFTHRKHNETDPTDSFYQSTFYLGLKEYLADPVSLQVPIKELAWRLGQNDLKSMEFPLEYKGKDYTMRVIGYGADFYVQGLTDLAMENKNIYVQMWNDKEFYFHVLYERSHYSLLDAMAVNDGDGLTLFVSGERCSRYPRTQYVSAFRLSQNTFESVSFSMDSVGNDADVYHSFGAVKFRQQRWSFWRDGSSMSAVYCTDPSDEFLGRIYVSILLKPEDDSIHFLCYDEENRPREKVFLFRDGKLCYKEEAK